MLGQRVCWTPATAPRALELPERKAIESQEGKPAPLQPGLPIVSGPPWSWAEAQLAAVAAGTRSWTDAFSTFRRREVRDWQARVAPALGSCRENSGVSRALALERKGGGGRKGQERNEKREEVGGKQRIMQKRKKIPPIFHRRGGAQQHSQDESLPGSRAELGGSKFSLRRRETPQISEGDRGERGGV